MIFFWKAQLLETPLQIHYALLTDDFGAEDESFIVPDQYAPHILDLCELHLLTKQRVPEAVWQMTADRCSITRTQAGFSQQQAARQRASSSVEPGRSNILSQVNV
jgi:hypothetical protein